MASQSSVQLGDYVPSKIVKVKPDNLDVVRPQDEVKFVIPASGGHSYVDPAGSYLEGTFRMVGRLAGRPAPDPKAGIHACMRDVIIRDFGDSQIMEASHDYNVITALSREYSKAPSVQHARELFEVVQDNSGFDQAYGSTVLYKARDTADSMVSLRGSLAGTDIDGNAALSSRGQLSPYFKTHLEMGLWKSQQILPLIACGGLRMTMQMETAARSIVFPTASSTPGRLYANGIPILVGKPAAGDTKTDPTDEAFLNTDVDFTADFGIDIGDIVHIADAVGGTNESILGVCTRISNNAGKCRIHYVVQRPVTVDGQYAYAAGAKIFYKPAERVSDITSVQDWDGSALVSVNVSTTNGENQTLFAPSWRIDDLRMCLRIVSPPGGMVSAHLAKAQREGIPYQIMTNTLYRHNLSSVTGESSQVIPATQKMAKSIISQPLDQANFQNMLTSSLVMATPDEAESYQYVYGTQLIPRRRVKLDKYNAPVGDTSRVEPIHAVQLQQAFINAGIPCRDLHAIRHKFAIGRALNRYQAISDVSEETLSLQVTYGAGATQTKIYQHRVFGLRQLLLKLSGVEVMA